MRQTGSSTPELNALILLEHATKKDRAWLLAHPEFILHDLALQRFERLVKKSVQGTPIAYLTGVKEFYGLELNVDESVLIPRPETEEIVEMALAIKQPKARALDVGTGCGAIAIAIARHRPKWQVGATDISPAALAVARANARRHNVKIRFIKADLLRAALLRNQKFDIICANLPYVKNNAELSSEGKQEPAVALRGGADGLDIYRRFFAQVPAYLSRRGQVIIESDPWQQTELIKIAQKYQLGLSSQGRLALGFLNFRLAAR